MLDPGLVKGLIAVITMAMFLGICWWAYRPGNRDRFEADGLLAFGDDELEEVSNRPSALPAPSASTEPTATDRTSTEKDA
jgi:cytochrome c oxidase cbb3-type subunit 4